MEGTENEHLSTRSFFFQVAVIFMPFFINFNIYARER